MRFGREDTVFYAINYVSGKEKYIQNELIDIFGDKQSQGNISPYEGLYGTKDEIDDTEDFFPFVYIPVLII